MINLRKKFLVALHLGLRFVSMLHYVAGADVVSLATLGNEDPLLGAVNLPSEKAEDIHEQLYV